MDLVLSGARLKDGNGRFSTIGGRLATRLMQGDYDTRGLRQHSRFQILLISHNINKKIPFGSKNWTGRPTCHNQTCLIGRLVAGRD